MSWHVGTELLERYSSGTLDAALAWSVESHVTGCAPCREQVVAAGIISADRVGAISRGVQIRLDAPSPTPMERLLRVVGVPTHLARLIAATPSLTVSWLAAVSFVLVSAVVAARWGWEPQAPDRAALLFLTLTPLVPLAGIAAAFGPQVDPTYEIGLAAPLRSGRLLLVRAVAVLGSSLLLASVAAVFLPALGWTAAAWILPSLAVTAVSLSLSSTISPVWAAGAVAAGWLLLVATAEAAAEVPLAAFGLAGQLAAAVVVAVASIVLWSSRDRFEREVAA